MTDPITLATVTTIALTEGIKFLYNQAGSLLEAWRKRRSEKAEVVAMPRLSQDAALDGAVDVARPPDEAALAERVEDLELAFRALDPYLASRFATPIDPADPKVRDDVERLRELLEEIYGQRLTFPGEAREKTGTRLRATVEVERARDVDVAAIRGAQHAGNGADWDAKVTVRDAEGAIVRGIDAG